MACLSLGSWKWPPLPTAVLGPQWSSIEVTSWPLPWADGESTFWIKELKNNSVKCVLTCALKKNVLLRQYV